MKTILAILLFCTPLGVQAQKNCFEHCIDNFNNSTLPLPERSDSILVNLVGCYAPEFTVKSITGESLNTQGLKGKVIVLNFWFSSCAPCVAEIPGLNRLVDEYKNQDVVFIGFARENIRTLQPFLANHKFNYKIVSNDYDLSNLYCIIGGWPTNIIIDKNGIVRQIFSGGQVDGAAAEFVYKKIKPIIDKNLNL